MTNPTDTNQASEDELRVKVYNEIKLWLSPHESLQFIDDFMPIITSFIRTEKLKLLAEVRERVIGEDRKEHSPYCGIGCPHDELIDLYRCTCGLIGSPRNKQLEALTKLEAEL